MIQVELFKLCKELECDGAFEFLNEQQFEYRNLNPYYLIKQKESNNNLDPIKFYQLDTPELQFDFSIRKYTLFIEIMCNTDAQNFKNTLI